MRCGSESVALGFVPAISMSEAYVVIAFCVDTAPAVSGRSCRFLPLRQVLSISFYIRSAPPFLAPCSSIHERERARIQPCWLSCHSAIGCISLLPFRHSLHHFRCTYHCICRCLPQPPRTPVFIPPYRHIKLPAMLSHTETYPGHIHF